MKRVISILGTDKRLKEGVVKWLRKGKSNQKETCPFSSFSSIAIRRLTYITYCATICAQLFPRCSSMGCPCHNYTLKYVKQIAKQIIAGKFDEKGVKEYASGPTEGDQKGGKK